MDEWMNEWERMKASRGCYSGRGLIIAVGLKGSMGRGGRGEGGVGGDSWIRPFSIQSSPLLAQSVHFPPFFFFFFALLSPPFLSFTSSFSLSLFLSPCLPLPSPSFIWLYPFFLSPVVLLCGSWKTYFTGFQLKNPKLKSKSRYCQNSWLFFFFKDYVFHVFYFL